MKILEWMKEWVLGPILLWVFMIGGGLALKFFDTHYGVYLVLVLLVAPFILWLAPKIHQRNLKKKGS